MSQGLKPTTDLSNRIARIYPSLSNGHRRAADFVLQHPLDVATMTIEGLAEGSGTSNATVTRFVRALGYGGYGEFRGALSAALKFAHDPVDSFAGARSAAGSTFATFTAALADQNANLQAARDGLDEASVTRAVELLLKAPRVFIAASGASHHVASFLEDGLALYLDADVIFASSRTGPERAIAFSDRQAAVMRHWLDVPNAAPTGLRAAGSSYRSPTPFHPPAYSTNVWWNIFFI